MAKPLNPQLRTKLLEAAEASFAEAGYQGATMAQIAQRVGVSTGNVYRYFANKDALFGEVVSAEFAARFSRILKRRLGSLSRASDLTELDATARTDGEALLRFWIENRLKVIVLLERAQGSAHEGFAERFVDMLLKPTLARLRRERGAPLSPVVRTMLTQVFRNTVRMIVAILESDSDEASIRLAFQGFWTYQLAGLAGLSKWVHHA